MSEPVVAQKAPYPVEVEAGKSYFWCACGRSKKQPFCDGSHKDTGFTPLRYDAQESGNTHTDRERWKEPFIEVNDTFTVILCHEGNDPDAYETYTDKNSEKSVTPSIYP